MLSTRKLLSLFVAVALVAAQWAGQLHALSHAEHNLAVAVAASAAPDGEERQVPPPLDHSPDHCVAFHALDAAAGSSPAVVSASATSCLVASLPHLPPQLADRVPFSSRAPPVSFS